MIEPVCSGPALARAIRETVPHPGTICVWWLGQSGYAIRSRTSLVVFDPYLSESLTVKYAGTSRPHIRMTRCPMAPTELSAIDLIVASHKHSDHMDPGTLPALLDGSPCASLVVPTALIDHARGLAGCDPERVVGIVAGETMRHGELTLHALPSAHEGLDTDAQGHHLYLGYVLEIGGLRLYHSGDSLVYEGLAERLRAIASTTGGGSVDVLFLPINGRDPARGVPGNMTAAEAVGLANAVRPRFVVPHHYDMFTFNTVPVEEFLDATRSLEPGIQPVVLECGACWEVGR
ncbi:MAG: MBL fold metallo-hydrolase [Isosphaeraceae bacterium]